MAPIVQKPASLQPCEKDGVVPKIVISKVTVLKKSLTIQTKFGLGKVLKNKPEVLSILRVLFR